MDAVPTARKSISLVSGCYNEEENVHELYERVTRVLQEKLPEYCYEFIIIDNASTDGSVKVLKELARQDRRLKIIVNNRNFGHVRSPYHAFLQARGDAVVFLASDLEDPPEMIPGLIRRWEQGYQVVMAQKRASEEFALFFMLRKLYYRIATRLSDVPLVQNVTGFGVYDRQVVEDIRKIGDPYPYFRGLICDMGYSLYLEPFDKPVRKRGITSNNFYTLWDLAMLGITNHSKVPLRLAVFVGCGIGTLSLLLACGYLVYKLLFWQSFQLGTAPLIIGMFFFSAVQLFFIGILGEYIGSIHTQVLHRPPVIERERINFD